MIRPENSSDRNRLWSLGILVALVIIVACKIGKTAILVCIERRWIRMEEMTDKELLQKNVEEFSRLQSYMKLCEKKIRSISGNADQIRGIESHSDSIRRELK